MRMMRLRMIIFLVIRRNFFKFAGYAENWVEL